MYSQQVLRNLKSWGRGYQCPDTDYLRATTARALFTGNEEDVKELVKEEEPEEVMPAQKKRFNALPIDEQVKEILLSLFEKSIHELRLDVLIAIDPSRQFFHNLDKMTNRQSINPLWEALLENCTKDKDYANQVLEKIALSKDKLRKRPSETYEELKKATLIF